jgi:hypothetical protein
MVMMRKEIGIFVLGVIVGIILAKYVGIPFF